VVGTAYAGRPFAGVLERGGAVRIMTGAPLPRGADAVVMQEDAVREDEWVSCQGPLEPGAHVRPRGEHLRQGDLILRAGTRCSATEIGLATAVGATSLPAMRRLSVGVASTGDELVDPPARLREAGSFDGNRPMIAAACRSAGFAVTDFGICGDSSAAFADLLAQASHRRIDALVVIGGSALGDADVVRQAAHVQFVPMNIRPGRGITVGKLPSPGGVLLGLPGNAVAAFVMFHFVALPVLDHLAGGEPRLPEPLPMPLAADVACDEGRVDYRRGRVERYHAGGLAVRPLTQQGTGMLRTLVEADVLIAAGPAPHYRAGSLIGVVPLATLPR
jgi:molybdopterin molybdotransferase